MTTISVEHLRALGRITVRVTHLEWLFGVMVGALVEDDLQIGEIIVAHISFRSRLDVIYSVFRYKYKRTRNSISFGGVDV
jgi:hypothetical protein